MINEEVHIPVDNIQIIGNLVIPDKAVGLIVFSHGSGSSRFSPRNNMVAERLRKKKFGTLLMDLLTEREDQVYANRFNINLLTARLVAVTKWLIKQETTKDLPIAYFGASTGAASALNAAAELGDKIHAVVSRGGRPDLAMDSISWVKAPTLLIVGSLDTAVIDLNRKAFQRLQSKKELSIIPGASHLFEEPNKLEQVADLATQWYEAHMTDKVLVPD